MKLIKISEIEANDDHRWDNVTLGPITVVLALALAAQVVFGLGCADTDSNEETSVPVGEARSVAYGELAINDVFPDNLWVSGLVQPYADLGAWPIRSGGFNKFYRTSVQNGTIGIYNTPIVYATLGQPLPTGARCVLVGSYANGYMNCNGLNYKCPKAQLVTPTAYSNGTAPPTYNYADKFNVTFKSVLAYGQFYRSGDSFRCDYPLAGASFNIVKK